MPEGSHITDAMIDEIIECAKTITANPSPKNKTNGAHKETSFTASSGDGKYSFQVFVREHTELIENFSVGLVYTPNGGVPFVVTRYNGQHGQHKNFLTGEVFDDTCHIHKVKEDVVRAGINYDNNAEVTDRYSSLDEALGCFFSDLHFGNYETYYPELAQGKLL